MCATEFWVLRIEIPKLIIRVMLLFKWPNLYMATIHERYRRTDGRTDGKLTMASRG